MVCGPSLTCDGTEKPLPFATSARVRAASAEVLWPKSTVE